MDNKIWERWAGYDPLVSSTYEVICRPIWRLSPTHTDDNANDCQRYSRIPPCKMYLIFLSQGVQHLISSHLSLNREGHWGISHILELREIFLSFQTDFNLVNAAVVCAILGLELPSVFTEPRYWKPPWQSQASVHLLWSLCWCHWCYLSPAWSSQHWSPCRRLWRLC